MSCSFMCTYAYLRTSLTSIQTHAAHGATEANIVRYPNWMAISLYS